MGHEQPGLPPWSDKYRTRLIFRTTSAYNYGDSVLKSRKAVKPLWLAQTPDRNSRPDGVGARFIGLEPPPRATRLLRVQSAAAAMAAAYSFIVRLKL
jgi:hypothetical protein